MNFFGKRSTKPDDTELTEAVQEFVGAFETVFHHDWSYTKIMLFDESEGCTFLKPGLEDETEDWGSRGELLEKYRILKSILNKRGLASTINPIFKANLERDGLWIP